MLASIVAELEAGRTPYGKCAELRAHAEQFEDAARDVIGLAEARRVAAELARNHDVEGMAMALSAGTERDEAMRQLAEASGRFMAGVHRLRV